MDKYLLPIFVIEVNREMRKIDSDSFSGQGSWRAVHVSLSPQEARVYCQTVSEK